MRAQKIIGALISLNAVFALAAPVGSQMKARVAWTSFASNMSGTWVAREEGLFKKNGLEVELVHIPSTSRAIQALLAGERKKASTKRRLSNNLPEDLSLGSR